MSLLMRVRSRRGYLTVYITGEFDLDEANRLVPRILDACADKRSEKLLIDARGVTGSLSLADRVDYAETFARLYKARRIAGNFKSVQIGVVANAGIIHPQKFGESVARSRGLDVKVSTDLREVLVWLGVGARATSE